MTIDGTTLQVLTFAGSLLSDDFMHYDGLLRSTVARCMAYRPGDRPSMLELERTILSATTFWDSFPRPDGTPSPDAGHIGIAEIMGIAPPWLYVYFSCPPVTSASWPFARGLLIYGDVWCNNG